MMFKLAIATLFLIGSIHCDGVKSAASNTRAYFVANAPRATFSPRPSQAQFQPAQARPRPQTQSQVSAAASATSGQAVRYDLPVTSFSCSDKPYIPGIYADVEANCEVYHVCTPEYRYSFACGEGSVFNQTTLVCDWPANVTCADSPKHYSSTAGIGVETGIVTAPVQKTSFTCAGKPYVPGLYADQETNCRTYHVCVDDQQFDLNCGEGTVFSQEKLTCDYPSEVNCAATPNHYSSNAGIGVPLAQH